jgi:hypothetical protein
VAGRLDPLEDIDRTVFQTRAVCETDVEVDRDVGAADAELVGLFNGPPHVDSVFFTSSL